MAKRFLLVTNNDKAFERYGEHAKIGVNYLKEESFLGVLIRVRDLIHEGWHLMSHPQASNLKPNQSPYKTVLLSSGREAQPFSQDVAMVESSIDGFHKFTRDMIAPKWPEKTLHDFQTIDLSVVESAMERALRL